MYAILVVETCGEVEIELCSVGTNPSRSPPAACEKTIGKRSKVPRYRSVRVVEVGQQS
jgi:hypothetical protein